jgi:hypothetical protein
MDVTRPAELQATDEGGLFIVDPSGLQWIPERIRAFLSLISRVSQLQGAAIIAGIKSERRMRSIIVVITLCQYIFTCRQAHCTYIEML